MGFLELHELERVDEAAQGRDARAAALAAWRESFARLRSGTAELADAREETERLARECESLASLAGERCDEVCFADEIVVARTANPGTGAPWAIKLHGGGSV
jgi:hypothetical protein